jgi:hypothetical protein
MTAKKTVTLTHPSTGHTVEVVAGDEDVYASQGWLSPDEAKNAPKPADA